VVERVPKVEMTFIVMEGGSQAVCEGCPTAVVLWFRLKRGDDGTKYCQKMKRMQRAHLGSIRRKRDTTRQCDDVDRMRDDIRKGKGGNNVR
jgi:hypothetical protein